MTKIIKRSIAVSVVLVTVIPLAGITTLYTMAKCHGSDSIFCKPVLELSKHCVLQDIQLIQDLSKNLPKFSKNTSPSSPSSPFSPFSPFFSSSLSPLSSLLTIPAQAQAQAEDTSDIPYPGSPYKYSDFPQPLNPALKEIIDRPINSRNSINYWLPRSLEDKPPNKGVFNCGWSENRSLV